MTGHTDELKYKNVTIDCQQIAWYLSFELCVNKTATILAGVYLSSNSEHKKQVLDSFEKWIDSKPSNKSIMICGDFNIDMLSDTTHSRRLKNICDDYGLNFLVKSPTRMTENSSTLIDLCVSNISMNRIECNVSTEEQISDHGLLFITINGRCDKSVDKKRKIQVWANYNENDLSSKTRSTLGLRLNLVM